MLDFTDYQHAHYAASLSDWELAAAFHKGQNLDRYLVQLANEVDAAFRSRVQLADFRPYLADTITRITGSLFQHEADVERSFGSLGDPQSTGTTAYRLWRNADGEGRGWPVMLRQLVEQLLVYGECWFVVEGQDEEGSDARIRLLPPTAVPNYTTTQAIVKSVMDVQQSVFEKPESTEVYTVFDIAGWQRYSKKNGRVSLVASGTYAENRRTYLGRDGRPILPIQRVTLPFTRNIGAQMARAACALYNMESTRDALIRNANTPLLILGAGTDGNGDEDFYRKIVDQLLAGARALPYNASYGEHRFIAPDSGCITVTNETLKAKEDAFSERFFALLASEATVQRSATEIAAGHSSGLGAALSIIAGTVESFESTALHLLEQVYSDNATAWTSSCEWPDNYSSIETGNDQPSSL